jgi:mono/diheme cytochrome c family protein
MTAPTEPSRGRQATLSAYVAALLAIAACTLSMVANGVADGAGQLEVDTGIANAWRVLRVVDCARCHGKDYTGLAAPSIVDYAALQSRETFVRMILDGDAIRGMPGYRSNTVVVENLDDIYRYFRARASGDVGPDYRPAPPAGQRRQ